MKTTISEQAAAVKPLAAKMEEEATHTPGPWVAEFLPPASSAMWFVRAKNEDASICHLERGKAHSREQQAADARLIASAPKLLSDRAALLAALKTAVRVMQDNNLDESMAGEFEQFTDAIQQAEGGAK